MNRFSLITSIVGLAVVIAFLSVIFIPPSTEPGVKDAQEARDHGVADVNVLESPSEEPASVEVADEETPEADDSAEETPEEGDTETPEEKAAAAYEKAFDAWVEKQESEDWKPTAADIVRFKASFDTLTAEQKLEQIPHAQNLFEDRAFGFLKAILMDPKEPKDVLESIYQDILNRPEELKYPVLREVYQVNDHPLRSEIAELDELLGSN